jgi:hypothetical protein
MSIRLLKLRGLIHLKEQTYLLMRYVVTKDCCKAARVIAHGSNKTVKLSAGFARIAELEKWLWPVLSSILYDKHKTGLTSSENLGFLAYFWEISQTICDKFIPSHAKIASTHPI